MGHKKRHTAPRSKITYPSSASSVAAVSGGGGVGGGAETGGGKPEVENGSSNESAEMKEIKEECERALSALRKGNHNKALKLLKNSRHQNSAMIHRVQSTICVRIAASLEDPNVKLRHTRNAIDSAKHATELSPNSIEFAQFYANLLFENANDAREYEEVVAECERALMVEIPIDPAKQSLQKESEHKLTTAEARIGHVQNELRNLIQKSNFASISSWMKNLGGDDKFRLIPIRRVAEDPMEARLVQSRRPNEIKRATKTPEERRKEIEVRVTAGRLLQQTDSLSLGSGGESDRGLDSDSVSVSGNRMGERRKFGRKKNGSLATSILDEKKDMVRSYLNSISFDMKRDLLKVRVIDMEEHFRNLKDAGSLACNLLGEAVILGADSWNDDIKTWKFWECCRCNMRFIESENFMHHVVEEHLGSLVPKMKSVVPQNIDSEWSERILNCPWKPLDVSATSKIFGNHGHCLDEEFSLGESNNRDDGNYYFKDAWDSSSGKNDLEDSCVDVNSINDTSIATGMGPMGYSFFQRWPEANDSECAKLLERISTIFHALIRNKCLAESHFTKIMQYATVELQGVNSGTQLLSHGVDQTPMCICFLGAAQLRYILKFLQEVSHYANLGRYPEKNTGFPDAVKIASRNMETEEKIVFDGKTSSLLLDDCLFLSEHKADRESAKSDATANIGYDTDLLLLWIYSEAVSTGLEQVLTWMQKKEEKTNQALEVLQMLEKEFYMLQSLCERKLELVGYQEVVQAIEDLCLEEGKRKENSGEFACRNYESVLKKRKEELEADESDDSTFHSKREVELETISSMLKEAETANVNHFGYEDGFASRISPLCDLESCDDEDWRSKGYMNQVDTCIERMIQRQKDEYSAEISKIDARMLRNIVGMQQLELKLGDLSAYDYQNILVPLLQSYMRTYLEDLAQKDATKKSDAAREAFLAELALDSNKDVKGVTDSSRHVQEKSKDKKKQKESRKTKDFKASGTTDQHVLYDKINEPGSFLETCDNDQPDHETVASTNEDDLKEQEEELRRKIELEAEERKLEETLEYQRRIENEAKLRQLAEQQKKLIQMTSGMTIEGVQENSLGPQADNQDTDLKSKPQLKDTTILPSEFEDTSFNELALAVPNNSCTNNDVQKTRSINQPEIKKGLLTDGFPEDGVVQSDRRAGRKGRRQRSAAKAASEGKSKGPISAKENLESGRSLVESRTHDNENIDGEYQTKTLRQLQAEEDDEERFQADLKKAVRQSLDTYQAQQLSSQPSTLLMWKKNARHMSDLGLAHGDKVAETIIGTNVVGTGLQNEVGEYNCFLNVIIQSLWHIRRFRDDFLKRSTVDHFHVGDPCVVCALHDIFMSLSVANADVRRQAVAPTFLRIALSNLYPDSNFFQEGQMNDASEVLEVIFNCLHESFTHGLFPSEEEQSWDCNACLVHSLFGMNISEQMNCIECKVESRHLKYTTFFHNINANLLREKKALYRESTFDQLLYLVMNDHHLACDEDAGGCGFFNYIHHFLCSLPHVFITVLGWKTTCESADDIAATISALSTEIDIGVLYWGSDASRIHKLVSVVCYYGQHYHCFAYSYEHEQWLMYDDKTVKVIGSWADVLTMCEKGHLQPQVLFFEAVK